MNNLLLNAVFGPGIFWILFVIFLFCRKSKTTYGKINAQRIPVISLILILILVSPPLSEIIAWPLYCVTPKNSDSNADAIVVLGGGIEDLGYPSRLSTERAYVGSCLFLQGRAPLLILSTGYTKSYVNRTEAQAMQLIALGMGVAGGKILLENKSYNTHTNASETMKLLKQYNVKSIILVTSFNHLYRAMRVFKKIGIKVYPYSTNVPKLLDWNVSWRRPAILAGLFYEYAAIAVYGLRGWL